MKDKGKLWNKKRYFSFCSKHSEYIKDCDSCNAGIWIKVWKWKIGGLIYKITPKLWIWWVNK